MPKGGEDSTLVPSVLSTDQLARAHTIIPPPYLELPPFPASTPLRKVCLPDPHLQGVQWVLGMMPGWDRVGAGCTARELVVQRVPAYRMV
jgi:hypothetical protein